MQCPQDFIMSLPLILCHTSLYHSLNTKPCHMDIHIPLINLLCHVPRTSSCRYHSYCVIHHCIIASIRRHVTWTFIFLCQTYLPCPQDLMMPLPLTLCHVLGTLPHYSLKTKPCPMEIRILMINLWCHVPMTSSCHYHTYCAMPYGLLAP